MKIATWNVNGIRARQAQLCDWLARDVPDIVCLQELKAPQEKFPEQAIADAGYGAIWHGQKSWWPAGLPTSGSTAGCAAGKASDHAPVWINLADTGRTLASRGPRRRASGA